MPSVGSISIILERSQQYHELACTNAAAFPLIDPLDAFYLLNPSGDLSSTQAEFENWFRDKKFEVIYPFLFLLFVGFVERKSIYHTMIEKTTFCSVNLNQLIFIPFCFTWNDVR